jgi:tripartite-type tricarboxylate transporter receptor subunit TctC
VAVPVATSASPEAFDSFVKSEVARWSRIIKDNQIRLD